MHQLRTITSITEHRYHHGSFEYISECARHKPFSVVSKEYSSGTADNLKSRISYDFHWTMKLQESSPRKQKASNQKEKYNLGHLNLFDVEQMMRAE